MVTGVQTCALPISRGPGLAPPRSPAHLHRRADVLAGLSYGVEELQEPAVDAQATIQRKTRSKNDKEETS